MKSIDREYPVDININIMGILKHWKECKVGAEHRHLFPKLFSVFNKEKKTKMSLEVWMGKTEGIS